MRWWTRSAWTKPCIGFCARQKAGMSARRSNTRGCVCTAWWTRPHRRLPASGFIARNRPGIRRHAICWRRSRSAAPSCRATAASTTACCVRCRRTFRHRCSLRRSTSAANRTLKIRRYACSCWSGPRVAAAPSPRCCWRSDWRTAKAARRSPKPPRICGRSSSRTAFRACPTSPCPRPALPAAHRGNWRWKTYCSRRRHGRCACSRGCR